MKNFKSGQIIYFAIATYLIAIAFPLVSASWLVYSLSGIMGILAGVILSLIVSLILLFAFVGIMAAFIRIDKNDELASGHISEGVLEGERRSATDAFKEFGEKTSMLNIYDVLKSSEHTKSEKFFFAMVLYSDLQSRIIVPTIVVSAVISQMCPPIWVIVGITSLFLTGLSNLFYSIVYSMSIPKNKR